MSDDIDLSIDEKPKRIVPSLFDINKSFEVLKSTDGRYTGIKGEEEARMVIFTNFILGEKPVILKGSRASGKTALISVAGTYARNPLIMASSSEKAFQRNKNLNQVSHFVIPEVNKVNEQTIELLKDMGEDAAHNYTFLNDYKEPETITINPKPFITSIADENKNVNALGEELLSRLTVVRTDSSIKQNIAVIEEKLRRAENPFSAQEISQAKIQEYIDYVKGLPSIKQFGFVYPAGATIRSAIPPLFTDSRRDTDKYLFNTYGITLFHFFNRIRREMGGKVYLFVTPADMWYNHIIYQNILLESSLKCGKMEKEIIDILKTHGDTIKSDEWGNRIKGMKTGEIHTELLKKSYTPTVEAVRKYCDNLMEIGYLTRNEEVRPFRYSLNPELQREYRINVDWKKVVDACKVSVTKYFPEIADEYISKYCDNGLQVTHPFTGEKMSLLDYVDDNSIVSSKDDELTIIESPQPLMMHNVDKQDELSVNGVVDTKDSIEAEIIALLSDNKEHDLTEFYSFGSDSDVSDILEHLVRIQEIMKTNNGKYLILR